MISLSKILNWLHKQAIYLPYFIGLLSILTLISIIILGKINILPKAGIILFPLILISAILIYNQKSLNCNEIISGHSIPTNILTKLFFIITSLEILWLLFGNRETIQLVLLFVMYLLIILQLFSKKNHPILLLAEIMLTTTILVLPQLYVGGYYYGDTDIITHSNIATIISISGGLPTEMFGTYQFFCLYHILIAIATQSIGFVSNDALYLVSTIAVIGSIPFVYLIAHHFTRSTRLSVLTAFFYSIAPQILRVLLDPAPRVMASMAFIVALYFLFTAKKNTIFRFVFLTIIIVTYMTGVHHAQIILIFAVLAFLCLGSLLYCKKLSPGNITIFMVIVLLPIVWQVYEYLEKIINNLDSRLLNQIEANSVTNTILENPIFEFDWNIFLSYLSSGVMVVLIFTALYFLLTKLKRPRKICVLYPLLLVMFIFFVPGVADAIPFLVQSLQLYRFRILLTLFFALAMAIGCYVLLNISKERKKQIVSLGVVVILCSLFVFSSAIVHYSGPSALHYELNWVDATSVNYYTEVDESAFKMITEFVEEGNTIHSSREFASYFNRVIIGGSLYGLPNKINTNMRIIDMFTEPIVDTSTYQYILLPYERYLNIGLRGLVGKSGYVETEYKDIDHNSETYTLFKSNTNNHKEIYDNGDDMLFLY